MLIWVALAAMALQQYGWGVPAFVLAQITNRAFFAQQDTKTPMQIALVSVAVNIALGITLFHFVGVAVGVALLPRLSRAVHAGDMPQARGALDQAITFCMAFTLPAAAALISMPFFLIDGLYTRGEFRVVDAHATATALQQYGWGVPAFVLAQITNRAFFAQQDTKTPMQIALVSVAVNVALGVTLFHFVGVAGIAAATSAAWWVNVILMATILARRGVYAPSPAAWSHLARVLAASVALGLLLAAASHWRPLIEAPMRKHHLGPLHAKEIAVVAVSALAALVYPMLLFASGGLSLSEVRAALQRRS